MIQNDAVLREAVDRLVRAYQPKRIYLFGSRARGDAADDSDYDLMVVVADDVPDHLQSSGLAYECLAGLPRKHGIDIVVFTENAFAQRVDIIPSLPGQVVREGKLLHVA